MKSGCYLKKSTISFWVFMIWEGVRLSDGKN